jgi:hypothetical protein
MFVGSFGENPVMIKMWGLNSLCVREYCKPYKHSSICWNATWNRWLTPYFDSIQSWVSLTQRRKSTLLILYPHPSPECLQWDHNSLRTKWLPKTVSKMCLSCLSTLKYSSVNIKTHTRVHVHTYARIMGIIYLLTWHLCKWPDHCNIKRERKWAKGEGERIERGGKKRNSRRKKNRENKEKEKRKKRRWAGLTWLQQSWS